ncbi:hypothetical protein BT63DRAFT_429448 [Microthyrium microscopicum]|uniref:Uncharacterized protein n=1 Tax=Microthyrium microscopicum TaxID=703497 RepID=A0A6A6TX97_9PEZI|nr:hypothetical protein BT63DRAFT_429448 [Microthyrium microscopicum]
MVFFKSLVSALLLAVSAVAQTAPPAPGLTYLYTVNLNVSTPIDLGVGPAGLRRIVPVIGGVFTGPKLNGTAFAVGGDFGFADPKTTVFYSDTRYAFNTSDGALIYVTSTGASVNGTLHSHFKYETSSAAYAWLNTITTIGVGKINLATGGLKVDTWYF